MELIQSDCPTRCRRYSSKAHGNPTVHHLGLAEQIISPAEASEYSSMTLLQRSIDKIKSFVDCSSVSSTSNAEISAAVADSLDVLGFDVEKTTYLDPRGVTKVNLVASRKPLAAGGYRSWRVSLLLPYGCHSSRSLDGTRWRPIQVCCPGKSHLWSWIMRHEGLSGSDALSGRQNFAS